MPEFTLANTALERNCKYADGMRADTIADMVEFEDIVRHNSKHVVVLFDNIKEDGTGSKTIKGNSADTNWTFEEAQSKLKYFLNQPDFKKGKVMYMFDMSTTPYFCLDCDMVSASNCEAMLKSKVIFENSLYCAGTQKGYHMFYKKQECWDMSDVKTKVRANKQFDLDLLTKCVLVDVNATFDGGILEWELDEMAAVFDDGLPQGKQQTGQNSNIKIVDTDWNATEFMNEKVFETDMGDWNWVRDGDNIKFTNNSGRCCSSPDKVHKTDDHSCVFLNKGRYLTTTCFSHGAKKLKIEKMHMAYLQTMLGIECVDDEAILEEGRTVLGEIASEEKKRTSYMDTDVFLGSVLHDTGMAEAFLQDNDEIFYHDGEQYKCVMLYNNRTKVWEELEKGEDAKSRLRYAIRKRMWAKYEAFAQEQHHKLSKLKCEVTGGCGDNKCASCEKKDKYNTYLKVADNQKASLKKVTFLNSYATAVGDILRSEPINRTMDIDPDLFCFDNCTMDLSTRRWVQRGKTDYITHTCGYDYTKSKKSNVDAEEFIKEILPDDEERESYISILRTGLSARRPQKFTCANGAGRNGKGMITSLMAELLGKYFYKPDVQLLTQKMTTGKADPAVAKIHRKRLCVATEPQDGDTILGSTVKNLTGENIINARTLYSDKTQIQNNATWIMECNERLKIDGDVENASMTERYVDIAFNVRFLSKSHQDYKENNKYVRLCNPKLSEDKHFIRDMATALFHYIVDNGRDEIYEPECVKQRSRDYLRSCNGILEYFAEKYEPREGHVVKLVDILQCYKSTDGFRNMDRAKKRQVTATYLRNKLKNEYQVHERKKVDGVDMKNIIIGYARIEDEWLIN
jgi:phage/plasmid-associated DNA primase